MCNEDLRKAPLAQGAESQPLGKREERTESRRRPSTASRVCELLCPGWAHIIPHLGNDLRLTIHLALEVPPGNQSRIGVADKTVNHTHPGQLLIFDDAYDHEVWNNASEFVRYVLGIAIWHRELKRSQLLPPVPSYNFWLGLKGTSPSSRTHAAGALHKGPRSTRESMSSQK